MADFNAPSYGTRMNIYDPRGNAAETVSSAGTVLSSLVSVDAFGQSSGGAFLFDTQHTFPTNQAGTGPNSLALGFREYDTTTGRFLKRDPLGYGGGINLYGYTQNNPIDRDDPTGFGPDPRYLGTQPFIVPGVPYGPVGVDIRKNIRACRRLRRKLSKPSDGKKLTVIGSRSVILSWYTKMVAPHHDWDYKYWYGDPEFDHFGNFNAGATGAALGIPFWLVIFGARESHFYAHLHVETDHTGDREEAEGYEWYIKTYGKVDVF